jgi:hypothetical protein
MISRASCWLAAVVACLFVSGAARAVDVAPHRAIYEMALKSSDASSDISDVRGTMQFQWTDSCDGWSVDQRSMMTFLYNSGDQVDLGWSLVSWEAKDGKRYRFFVRKYQNGEVYEELRGDARLEADGTGGVADYTLPAPRQARLPAGTMFPTTHSLALLARAESGQPFLWADVFDGSDESGLFGVSAVIVGRRDAGEAVEGRSPLLAAGPSWQVSLAFFPSVDDAPLPEHEQELRLHATGVVEDLILNYGDFTISATLKKLEALPPADC